MSPELNAVGDLVLDEPETLRALAHPLRIAIHDRLRRVGPATAGDLAPAVGSDPTTVEEHVRALEDLGLVTREESLVGEGERWAAVGKGFVFEIDGNAERQAAARELTGVMLLQYADVPRRWVTETEPHLTLDWTRAAGLFHARVALTPDELRELQEGLERLLEPYLTRTHQPPAGAADVRILSYFLPEP